MVYGLTDGALPDPVTVVSSPSASAAGRERVAALAAKHPDVEVQESDEDVYAALSSTLAGYIQQEDEGDNPFGLP